MTHISKDKGSYAKFTHIDKHDEFLNRISKTLYYTKCGVANCLSLPVTELAAEIFTEVKNGQTLERLDVEEASRISRNACVSPCSLVLALLYLERLKDCNPEYLQRVAPSELFLVSLMVASKFLNDDGEQDEVFNTEWAQSGDLSNTKMNRLEKDFLKAINWSVYVHNEDFWKRLLRLEKHIAYKEACKRGWFSYTELNTLLDLIHLTELVNTLFTVSSICIATYAAGLITLLGSSIIATHLPGTLLENHSKQQNDSSSLTNLQHTSPAHKSSQIELEGQIDNILLNSVSEKTKICNNSLVEKDVNLKVNNWKWLIDSVTFWLPNCSHLKSINCLNNWEYMCNQNSLYFTKLNFLVKSNPFMQYSDIEMNNVIRYQFESENFST